MENIYKESFEHPIFLCPLPYFCTLNSDITGIKDNILDP